MKKQDIKVRINNDAESKEVRDLLLEAGEEIAHFSSLNEGVIGGYSYVVFSDEGWLLMLFTGDEALKEISIPQLREMLIHKQTVSIEVNEHDLPAIERVLNELAKARVKHPESGHYLGYDWHRMGSYLTEETLESIQAINDGRIHDAKIEVAQTAAVCLRILSGV